MECQPPFSSRIQRLRDLQTKCCEKIVTHDGVAPGVGVDVVAVAGNEVEALLVDPGAEDLPPEFPRVSHVRLQQNVRQGSQPSQGLVLALQVHEKGSAFVLISEK